MGHSNVSATEEYCTQVNRDHEAKAARIIQALIDHASKRKKSNKTHAGMTPEPVLGPNEGVE